MRRLDASGQPVVALAYAPDDPETLATLDAAGVVRLWNLVRGLDWASFETGGVGEGHLAFTPDGNSLYVSNRDTGPSCLDVVRECWKGGPFRGATHRLAAARGGILAQAPCGPESPRWWPDQLRVHRPAVFRPDYSPEVTQTEACPGGARGLAFSPGGAALAVADGEHRVRVWDVHPAAIGVRTLREYVPEPGRLGHFVERQEGSPLLTDRAARTFRSAAGPLAFAPGGAVLAVAVGRNVQLWDAALMERRQDFKGHTRPVRCLAFSPGGGELLAGGDEGTVRLWEVATGRQRAALDWGLGPVHAVAFALDGMTAAACGAGGPGAVLFDVDT
jgi:WD40 repeat protein